MRLVLATLALAVVAATWEAPAMAAAPAMDTLLPAATKGFLSSPDVPLMQEKWNQTQLGRWLDDPLMDPFLEDLRKNLRDDTDPDKINYGLAWDDIKELARGEAAVALVHTPPKRPARVVLVDVTGNIPAAVSVLNKIFTSLADRTKPAHQRASTWKQDSVHGQKLTVFTLPRHAKDPHRAPQAAYFIMNNVLGAAEDEAVAREVMGRLAGAGGGATLASLPGYVAVMRRCEADAAKADAGAPHVRWYINPVPYAEARRAIDSQFLKDGRADILSALQNSGFRGIVGAGGYVHLAGKTHDVLARTAVYAPPPYEKTLAGLRTENAKPVSPPEFIPANVSSFTGLTIDLPKLIDNIAPFYDPILGDEGAWKDTLEGIRVDKRGPQVDLEKRLFAKLGQQAMRVSDSTEEITVNSERRVIIAELADPKEALDALEAFYANDQTAEKKTFEEQQYWEIWPEQRGDDSIPQGVAVAHNRLFWASHADMLPKFLKAADAPLAEDADFRLVMDQIRAEADKRSWKQWALQRFVRSRDAYRPTYELTRQNKLPMSESLLGDIINMVAGQEDGSEPRKQETDGSLLPEYEKVQHYFLPSGSVGVREDAENFQGWFIVSFTLGSQDGGVANRAE